MNEEQGTVGIILHSNIDTVSPDGIVVVFSPQLTDNPFGLFSSVLTLNNPSLIDREMQEIYTLPITSAFNGETAYATVSCNGKSLVPVCITDHCSRSQ